MTIWAPIILGQSAIGAIGQLLNLSIWNLNFIIAQFAAIVRPRQCGPVRPNDTQIEMLSFGNSRRHC